MQLFRTFSTERWEACAAGKWGSVIILKRKKFHEAF